MLTAEQPTKLARRRSSSTSSTRKTANKKSAQQVQSESVRAAKQNPGPKRAANQSPFQCLEQVDVVKDNSDTLHQITSPQNKTDLVSTTSTTVTAKHRRITTPGKSTVQAPVREVQIVSLGTNPGTTSGPKSRTLASQKAQPTSAQSTKPPPSQPTLYPRATQPTHPAQPSNPAPPAPGHYKSCREGWERQVLMSLQHLFNKEETSDVVILLGNERIYVHRLILGINSKLLLSQTESNHNVEGRLTVDLLDYVEEKAVIKDVIASFYTGTLDVNRDNIEIIYKFSKFHSIWWLFSYCLKLFEEMIPTNFITIFQFATKIKCNSLKEKCYKKLDNSLFTFLLDNGEMWKLEPECMQDLVATDNLCIQEADVFYLVSRWFEYDEEKRGSYMSELLFNIRYHLMSKEELIGVVYDWVSAAQGIEDSVKLQLFVKINKYMRIPGLVSVDHVTQDLATQDKKQKTRKLSADDESLLKLIVHSVQNNNSARCADAKQLMKVLRESFPRANPTTKQCVIEYISDNQLVDASNITPLLQTYSVTKHQNILLLCVQYLSSSLLRNIHQVSWEVLSAEVVKDLILEIQAGKYEFLLAECVMRWCEAHTSHLDDINSLLSSLCYHNIPESYITRVLLPHVQKLLPDLRRALTCTLHKKHNTTTKPCILHHKAPPELYLLRSFEIITKHHVISLDKRYTDQPLTIVNRYNSKKKGRSPPGYFALYDMNTPLEYYPVSCKLTLSSLRQVLEKAANLYLVVMY